VAVEPYRERIEDFMRRYWREGHRVLRWLAVAVAVLLAILLALQALRALRVLAVAVLIVAILVLGRLLVGSLILPMPRLSPKARWCVTVLPLLWPAVRSADSRQWTSRPSRVRAGGGLCGGASVRCGITAPRTPPSARPATSGQQALSQARIRANSRGHADLRYEPTGLI
jgi:hypothetical protein